VDIAEALRVDIMATIMAGTTGGALTIGADCVLLLIGVIIGVIIVVGVTLGGGSIGDGHGHTTLPIIRDGHITIPTIWDGHITIPPIIQKLIPRHIANRNSSNPIIGTSVRTRRVTTLTSEIVRPVG